MRATVPVAMLLGALAGCSDSNEGASLTIDPEGHVDITGPANFTATLTNDTSTVHWNVSGDGQLSSKDGFHTTFAPPAGTNTQTLTASTDDGLTASVEIGSGPKSLDTSVIPGLTAPVTVQYDAQDIPHIKCAAIADCIAVQGFVQAHDRLFPMDFLRHVATAHLSEMIGIAGLDQDVQLRNLFITRDGQPLGVALAAAMDTDTKALVQRFADGVNAYLTELRAKPQNMPAEYYQLPFALTPADIADWTVADTMSLARLQQFQLSETIEQETGFGQFAQAWAAKNPAAAQAHITAWIRSAAPTTEQAHTLQAAAFAPPAEQAPTKAPRRSMAKWGAAIGKAHDKALALNAQLRPHGTDVGSNNWVVAAGASANGAAMVANDPHLGLQYPPLFHLSQMTSTNAADNLDLTGGSFPGIPGALVGRGAHVGWGVTVVGYDVTDVYLEDMPAVATCPNAPAPCVNFKGAKVTVIPVTQHYLIRTGPGDSLVDANVLLPPASRPPAATLIVPHHGPIIQAPDLTVGGQGVSVRWTGMEGNTQDVKAILGLNTATDVDSAIESLKGFSTGAQNWVLADDTGHIAYDPHALVPKRLFADARVTAPANLQPPWFPLPGDDGSAEWGDGTHNCAALTPDPACWTADTDLPQGKDPTKGYFFTANADPTATGVTDDNNPLAHPPYFSFDWDDSSGFRATRINELLGGKLAGGGKISLEDMQAIQADHVSRPGKAFTDVIQTIAVGGSESANLTAARAMLGVWKQQGFDCPSGLLGTDPVNSAIDPDPINTTNSQACYLFHEFIRILAANVFADDLRVAGQGVNGLMAIKTMLHMLEAATPAPEKTMCSDVNANGVITTTKTCEAQVLTALDQAYTTLLAKVGEPATWVWGRVHTIQPVSLLELVTENFSPGPYARPGGSFTVDVGTPALSGTPDNFQYFSGGNVRHISVMNPAQPIVKMQLPGPERDGPALFKGPDLLGQWVANTYFDYAFGNQIDAAAVSTQSFKAQ